MVWDRVGGDGQVWTVPECVLGSRGRYVWGVLTLCCVEFAFCFFCDCCVFFFVIGPFVNAVTVFLYFTGLPFSLFFSKFSEFPEVSKSNVYRRCFISGNYYL